MTDPLDPGTLADVGLRLAVVDDPHRGESGSVAHVTLDRPEVRNAQTPAMWRALAALGAALPSSVRVVVVGGEGPSFSAGLDRRMLDRASEVPPGTETVADLLRQTDEQVSATIDDYQRGFTWLRDPRFVSIAAVRGHAVGAGFQLALACDLRVVADDVRFSMREAALGLVPDLVGTKPLVAAVGYARALEICATSRWVEAEEAVRTGLAISAVPAERLDAAVAELVAALTTHPVGAVRETKALLLDAALRDEDTQRRLEREAQARRFRELASQPDT